MATSCVRAGRVSEDPSHNSISTHMSNGTKLAENSHSFGITALDAVLSFLCRRLLDELRHCSGG